MRPAVRTPDDAASPFSSKGLAVVLLLAAVVIAYANSLKGVFVFDDVPAIIENPTLRHPGQLGGIFFPPADEAGTVGGRPLVNASLALNFAWSGTAVASYHVFNIAVHGLATLVLFGVVRHGLEFSRRGAKQENVGRSDVGQNLDPGTIAVVVAGWWALHPLQTESVTYVVQRAESLMGLFYLVTLYCFLRSVEHDPAAVLKKGPATGKIWGVASVAACAAGMMTKEVMATAPLVVLLCDRALVAGSFSAALKRHRWLYAGFGACWVVLAFLVADTHGRGGSAGFSSAPLGAYLLTQVQAVACYLELAVWPHRLVFDYGPALVHDATTIAGPFVFLAAAFVGSVLAFAKNRTWGWLALAFFIILAPSSSVIPIATEPRAEHRMYLPLACGCALAAAGLARLARVWFPGHARRVFLAAAFFVAGGFGFATVQRNRDYASAVALWSSVTRNCPENPRGHNNLAEAWLDQGNAAAAEREFAAAISADPLYLPAHYNYGALLLSRGQAREAIPHLEKALAAPRHQAEAQRYLGEAYEQIDQPAEAAAHYREALADDPTDAEAAFGLGNNLALKGDLPAAVDAFRIAAKLAPGQARIRNNFGNALLFSGNVDEAIVEYRAALAREPANPQIQENLARALKAKEQGR